MAFWKKFYKSRYTGAEIDAAVAKAGDATKVTANPSLAGTEAALTGLEVGTTKYKVNQPINVVANPTLAGTESALEGLQVGDIKYKVYNGFEVVTFTQDETTSLMLQIMTALTAATDKLTKTTITPSLSSEIEASLVEKICKAASNPYMVIYSLGNLFVWGQFVSEESNSLTVLIQPFEYRNAQYNIDCLVHLYFVVNTSTNTLTSINVMTQKVNLST